MRAASACSSRLVVVITTLSFPRPATATGQLPPLDVAAVALLAAGATDVVLEVVAEVDALVWVWVVWVWVVWVWVVWVAVVWVAAAPGTRAIVSVAAPTSATPPTATDANRTRRRAPARLAAVLLVGFRSGDMFGGCVM
jgi:hypothetical protein